MLELADIFRAAGPAYREAYGPRMLPSHHKAMRDLEACRTAALGGQLWACNACDARRYSYHSCRNRHCPKCHRQQTERWLQTQRARLLPCPYFLATFTLPAQLRPLARSHQKKLYSLLLTAAAESLLALTADPDYLGARPGLLAVLHTWTRALRYHPHVHILVTAGGWRDAPTPTWIAPKRPDFLVPGRALSVVFRAKLRDALRPTGLFPLAPSSVWHKKWVVHLLNAGTGERALDYLARYVHRVALANSRLERFDHGQVTFRYRDNRTHEIKRCTLEATRFIARFLQHVLPAGFSKVRSYGLFSPSQRPRLEHARAAIGQPPSLPLPPSAPSDHPVPTHTTLPIRDVEAPRCPACRIGRLYLVDTLPPAPLLRPRPPP